MLLYVQATFHHFECTHTRLNENRDAPTQESVQEFLRFELIPGLRFLDAGIPRFWDWTSEFLQFVSSNPGIPRISTSTSEFLQKTSFPAGIPALYLALHGLWHRAYISICWALRWSDTRIVSFTTAKERNCTALACAEGHTTWQLCTNLAVLHPINETAHKEIWQGASSALSAFAFARVCHCTLIMSAKYLVKWYYSVAT